MKKRVMCVHTELVREGSVLYEGKDGNNGGGCRFCSLFFR